MSQQPDKVYAALQMAALLMGDEITQDRLNALHQYLQRYNSDDVIRAIKYVAETHMGRLSLSVIRQSLVISDMSQKTRDVIIEQEDEICSHEQAIENLQALKQMIKPKLVN